MTRKSSEHDEYLLSLLLDNDLPEDQTLALRQRLECEPDLRACYDRLVSLNAALVARRTSRPVIASGDFHEQLMKRLAAESSGQADELLISRSLDGELPADEELALRQRIDAEPALRQRHAEYRRLETALQAQRADQPQVNYSRFHRQVMKRVAAEAGAAGRTLRFPLWLRAAVPLAAAAAVALMVWLQPTSVVPTAAPSADSFALLGGDQAGSADTASHVQFPRHRDDGTTDGVAEVAIAYGRLDNPGDSPSIQDSQSVQVSYVRSVELADAIRQADEESANRPVKKFFFASAKPIKAAAGGADGEFLESAPM